MMPLASEVARLDSAQSQILGAASGELRSTVNSLPFGRPETARDALLEAFPAISDEFGGLSSSVSADWYEEQRGRAAVAAGGFVAVTAAPLELERLEQTVRWASGALFTDDPMSVYGLLNGSLERSIGDASRDTIRDNVNRDSAAYGWHRIARADGCDFCVMLSQRGAVYKRDTADFASHDNCRCRAAPSFDPSAPEVDVMAYEASERMESFRSRANDPSLSESDRLSAERQLSAHRTRVRIWIDKNQSALDDFRAELT